MYDRHPSSLVLQTRSTTSPTPHSDNATNSSGPAGNSQQSSSSSSTTTTTRPMRAGSCSSASPSNGDSPMSTTSTTEDSSPRVHHAASSSNSASHAVATISSFTRKRKCDAMEPRTALPTIATAAGQLCSPYTPSRPRSATCSSDRPLHSSSSATPPSWSRARHNSLLQIQQNQHRLRTSSTSTASCMDTTREIDGSPPKSQIAGTGSSSSNVANSASSSSSSSTLLTWKRTQRPDLPTFGVSPSLSSDSSEALGQDFHGMSKRPRLDSSASTGHHHPHHHPSSSICVGASRPPPHLEVETHHTVDDLPSAPPSASFSNLAITQPPSPAYAAFSNNTPPPAPGLSSPTSPSRFAFAQAKAQEAELELRFQHQADNNCGDRLDLLQVPPGSSSSSIHDASTTTTVSTDDPACQARPSRMSSRRSSSSSRRRDKSPATRLGTNTPSNPRKRFRRASSLPLEDEVTLARSQMMHHQHQQLHRRTGSTVSNASVSSTTSTPPMITAVRMTEESGVGKTNDDDQNMHGDDEAMSTLENRQSTANGTIAQEAEASGSAVQKEEESASSVVDAVAVQAHKSMLKDCITRKAERSFIQPQIAPVLVTPAQLSAMHQFNMPRTASRVPLPPTLASRPSFPPFPSRTQAYAQAQRRLLPIPVMQPSRLTSVSAVSINDAYKANPDYAPPPVVVAATIAPVAPPALAPTRVIAPEQRRPPPTASIPGYTPPIAKDTLKELDLQEVLQCRQLRHDVVFDANLMFRPNFDGDRGDRKREAADRYWAAVTRELETGCKCTAYSFAPSATARMMGRPSVPLPCICRNPAMPFVSTSISERLPSRILPLIQELRDILLALLPQPGNETFGADGRPRTHGGAATAQMVKDTLDPALIAQEVSHGVLDVASLATFFGHILKSHCAPMRDEVVEIMIRTVKQGGEKGDMSMVANGLRMCFEILELMKLDVANHQLRMLRPYLLETAADFEYKTFLHLREKKPQQGGSSTAQGASADITGPPLSKTHTWMAGIRERNQALLSATPSPDVSALVIDGVLELLFNPKRDTAEIVLLDKAQSTRQAAQADKRKAPRTQALPLSSEVPETFQLDMYRLQLFHGDVVDLCIVHLLILLYRQLCSANKRTPSFEDLESIRRQIWVIMSEINTMAVAAPAGSGRRTTSSLPQSIKKLESEQWREGMKDVLLQISRHSAGDSQLAGSTFVPDVATLNLLNSWMDNNFKPDGKLFELVQTRLRRTLSTLILSEIQQHEKSLAGKAWDMASAEVSPEARPDQDSIIKQNGLADLAGEARLLASRIAKVVGYNVHVFNQLYGKLLQA